MTTFIGYYYQAAFNYTWDGKVISPEAVMRILIQAQQNFGQLKFRWTALSKPKSGETILFIGFNPQQPSQIGDDGYFWSSYGQRSVLNFGKLSLEVTNYIDGYSLGDPFVTMTKTRYRIIVPDSKLQLVQYVAVPPEAVKIPVGPPVQFPKPMAVRSGTPTLAASNANNANIRQSASPSKKSSKKRVLAQNNPSSPNNNNVSMEEDESLSNDEYEVISAKDVSAARFQRNHDFMNEIFSSVSTVMLRSNGDEKAIEKLKSNYAILEDKKKSIELDIKRMESEHSQKLAKYKEESQYFRNTFSNALNDCNDLKPLDALEALFLTQITHLDE